jgi:hypothetical protein
MTNDELEYIETMSQSLPPVIARKKVAEHFGGVVSYQSLANADSSGTGPEVAYEIGRTVAYKTESLLRWIVGRYGVKRRAHLKDLEVEDCEQLHG